MRSLSLVLSLLSTLFPSILASVTYDLGLHSRQSATAVSATGNWTLVGCFSDVSTSRTLSAASIPAIGNMTLETCAAFCGSVDYIYAGVEFAKECYCDSTIQLPSVAVPLSDCNSPCAGNASEICGGAESILIYTNGKPSPVIVQEVEQWAYAGCFTDNVAARVLSTGIAIPAGVKAETCTATCQTAGYTVAGLENAQECWCGHALANSSIHVGDEDCRATCIADHDEYCGAANRLAVYDFAAVGSAPPPTTCSSDDIANFTLTAKLNNPPNDGSPSEIPLKMVLVEMVPSVTWAILSACPLCCSDWPTYSLQNSVFLPHSLSNPGQLMVSGAPGQGESPNFVASDPAFPGFQSYCAMSTNTTNTNTNGTNSPTFLAFGGIANAFALCTNTTTDINARLDVVFEPVSNHPNYVLDDCIPITIEINTGGN